jgi:PBP1b-binding outer membrane lipoprotein LpoB
MKLLIAFAGILFIISCNNNSPKNNEKPKDTTTTTSATTEKPTTPAVTQIPEITMPADSGKPYFKVAIYKNDQPFK